MTPDGYDFLPDPPSPLRRTSQHTLELAEGGGCAAIFGLLFFIAGGAMALGLAGVIRYENEPAGFWSHAILALMSLVFIAVGSGLMLGRRWTRLDSAGGIVSRQQGLLIPMRTRERPLSEFTAVVSAFREGDSDTPDKYPVQLRAREEKHFVILEPQKYAESRAIAGYLSQWLRLPLADTITDHETLVRPNEAGDSLRDRLRANPALTAAARPEKLVSQISQSYGTTTIVMPVGRKGVVDSLMLALFCGIMLFVLVRPALHFFSATGTPGFVQSGFVIAFALSRSSQGNRTPRITQIMIDGFRHRLC